MHAAKKSTPSKMYHSCLEALQPERAKMIGEGDNARLTRALEALL